MPRLWPGGFALLAALAGVWGAEADSHRAPAPSLSEKPRAVETERQNTLAEMWQRRILPPDADQWGPEETALLARLRGAEAAGAIDFLKSRLRAFKGLTVIHKPPSGESRLRLTREGYERYAFLRSQEALRYFEAKGTDAKWVFSLRDMEGRRLFEPSGLLTDAGQELYNRALAGLEARWKTSAGEILGNRPPPRPAGPIPGKP